MAEQSFKPTCIVVDAAERQRRLGQVYTVLLEFLDKKRQTEAEAQSPTLVDSTTHPGPRQE